MGNAAVKGLSPTGVVTIVLVGGRVEEFKKPIVAGDIMLRHPRHHVVRPDFFRSSPVVVLKPEEILMPGHKFFLVPFHTVHKKLSGKVEVLHQTSTSAPQSTGSATGGAHPTPASVQPGASKDDARFRRVSVGTQDSGKTGKTDSAGVANTRSPAGRGPAGLRKSSEPTTSVHVDRKTLRRHQMSRNKKRRSGDNDDYPRIRISPHSRTKRNSKKDLAARFRENESMESSDLTELQSFRAADFEKYKVSVVLTSTKPAPSADLIFPEYESFQTSVRASGESPFERTLSAVTEHESFDGMDFSEAEKASIAPFLPTAAALVKRLVRSYEARALNSRQQSLPKTVTSVEAMDESEPEKVSSEPPFRMPTPSPRASALGIEEKIHSRGADLCLDHPLTLEDHLKFIKSLTPVSSGGNLNQPKLPGSVKVIVQSFEENSRAQHILPKIVTSVEYEGTGTSKPREKSSIIEPPLRMPTRAPANGYPSGVGIKERINSRGGDSGPHPQIQTPKEDLESMFNKSPRPEFSKEVQLIRQKLPIRTAADSQQATSPDARQNGLRGQATALGEKNVGSQEQHRSSSGRSEQRSPRQQQETMQDQADGVKGRQQVHRRAENGKSVVKALNNGPTLKSSPVASNPLMTTIPGKKSSGSLTKPRKPRHKKWLVEHLGLSSQLLHSPRHAHAAAGLSREKTQIEANPKLIDHLKRESSEQKSYLLQLYKQAPLQAHATVINSARRLKHQSPKPRIASSTGSGSGSGSRSELPKTQQDNVVSLQPNKVINIHSGPSVLRQNDVEVMDVTPIEEKFLKLAPVSLVRRRARRRIYRIPNWRPKLSPLVEISP